MGLFASLRGKTNPAPQVPASPNRDAEALIADGNALEERGEWQPALAKYEAAVVIAPTFVRTHLNRGNALLAMGDVASAHSAYARALTCDPGHVGAHFNLGNALVAAGRLDEALRCYEEAGRLDPRFADACVAAGCVLEDLGRFPEAIASFRQALALAPDYAQVHSNLGNALKSAGRFDEAVLSQRRALELDPLLTQAHNNLGNALKDLGQLGPAEASYRQAVALDPGHVDALSNLLFLHNYTSSHPPGQLLAEARSFGEIVARRAQPFRAWRCAPEPDRVLRVGLVSGDLRDHPVGYFLESVVAALAGMPGSRLQITAYPTARCGDATGARIRANCHAWHPATGLSDAALARQIHDDAIDILIDLSGHTAHNRLAAFAWKPSPIQVTWLGYFATTGVAAIDYLIADPLTLPETQAERFTERIWRLPETRLCFTPPQPSPEVGELPAASAGVLTFACFNNLSKVNESVVALWARVLDAVPASRLLLKAPQLQDAQVRATLVASFAGRGIGADRLVLEGLSSRFEYLSRYREADIALDPFPFPGGTTTVEALWMGVPVLTLAGDSFLERQGIGLLTNTGLPGWVARDSDHYVELAATHAADCAGLAALRKRLRPQLLASPLMDAPRFAGHLDGALRAMWQQWCRSQAA